jgi:hypothetical protein
MKKIDRARVKMEQIKPGPALPRRKKKAVDVSSYLRDISLAPSFHEMCKEMEQIRPKAEAKRLAL